MKTIYRSPVKSKPSSKPKSSPKVKVTKEDRDLNKAIMASLHTSDSEDDRNLNQAIALSLLTAKSSDIKPSKYTTDNILETGGDGNCLFSSVAYELNRLGIKVTYREVRRMICDKMEQLNTAGELQPLMQTIYGDMDTFMAELMESMNAETFEEAVNLYIKDMRKNGTWGGELEFSILQKLYPEIHLSVYRENRGNYVLQPFLQTNPTNSGKHIRIFGNGVHFQVMEDNTDKIRDENKKKELLKLIHSRSATTKKSPKTGKK